MQFEGSKEFHTASTPGCWMMHWVDESSFSFAVAFFSCSQYPHLFHSIYQINFNHLFYRTKDMALRGLHQKPPKFEHIFVAITTFFPFFYSDIFDTNLLYIVCAFR